MTYRIGPIEDDDWDAVGRMHSLAFLRTYRSEDYEVFRRTIEPDRTLAAFDHQNAIASTAAYTLNLTTPGASSPAAGVTMFAVHPAYRRRGLLKRLVTRQFAELAEAGEPVAALWVTEASIYGRYGYAVAARRAIVTMERWEVALPRGAYGDDSLTFDVGSPTSVWHKLAEVHDGPGSVRPGHVSRNEPHWKNLLYDPEHKRDGATATQAVLVCDGDEVRGYALYDVVPAHDGLVATGTVRVKELHALDIAAYVAAWRFVAAVDLTARVTADNLPVDAPLLALLSDPRRARVQQSDGLWVRLIRIGEALANRCYCAPVDIVLDVRDESCAWNRGSWRLAGDEKGAVCERTAASPDLEIDVGTLASAYLGDSTLAMHEVTGRIAERSRGALRHLSAALSWDPRPWGSHRF